MSHECTQGEVFKMMNHKLDKLDRKLDDALKFKNTVIGIVTGVTSVSALIFTILKLL